MCTHLIAGFGYLGGRVGERWLAAGHPVAALTRSDQRAGHLEKQGITPIVGDITQPATIRDIPPADVILFAVGFDRSSGKSIDEVYVNGLANFLSSLAQPPKRFIYISSTGVYGQTDGEWVDEHSPCHPTRPGGRACLAAERLLLDGDIADRVVILRCAGLYGPGRIPRLRDIQSQSPIEANPDVWLNLIHIDDAADIAVQVAAGVTASRTYLLSDGQPVKRRDFYEHLTQIMGLPPPDFKAPDNASGRRAGGANKRINSQRLMNEIQPALNYPTYREGLAAIET